MYLLFLLVLFVTTDGAEKGDLCSLNNVFGTCTEASKCQTPVEDVNNKTVPVCQSSGSEAIICCGDTANKCNPIPARMTANKTGQKAWYMCIEYQKLLFPCEDRVRELQCPTDVVQLVLDGVSNFPKRNELSHLVLLGYTNGRKELDWLCAGSLISERFILTAAHCVASRHVGPATHVALRPTDRTDIDPNDIYKIRTIIRHPEYRPPRTYHDIALLELEQAIPLSRTRVPACIVGAADEEPMVTATTWNTHDVLGSGDTWLMKIQLSRFSVDECSNVYPDSRRGGYNDTTQVCYGDKTHSKDVCQDDGGSSLLVRHRSVSCMTSLVGVASYGRGCFTHSAGVYTRVQYYVPWIQNIVWS